jgi:tetratricopeptide (TPR) repeat protein
MDSVLHSRAWRLTVLSLLLCCPFAPGRERETEPQPARVVIHAGLKGCAADLDSVRKGETDTQGALILSDVEPGDHYIHVRCPGQVEHSYFISPGPGETVEVSHDAAAGSARQSSLTPLQAYEAKIELRRNIREAIRLRARGQIEEAVEQLRAAFKLDPDNSDLHREMGITFLLGKEWKRARVEMLEAIHHDPNDADAHNSLGYALEKLGDLKGALEEYRAASHLEPDDQNYRRHYINVLAKLVEQQALQKK